MTDALSMLPLPESAAFWEIQRHFLDRSNWDMAMAGEVFIGVACVSAGLIILMLIIHLRPRKPYVPQDWVTDPEQIADTITMALDQRVKFELHFKAQDDVRRPSLRCMGVETENGVLILEASGVSALSKRWVGRQVECFFILRRREKYLFYAFATVIRSIHTSTDLCLIRVAMPEKIEGRQKRSYLRIAPPEEFMLGAALWRGPEMPEECDFNDLALWQPPSRIFLPGTRTDFTIGDISSGGLRLHLSRQIVAEEMEEIHVSSQVILMLDLWDPDRARRLRFWLLCRTQSPVLDFESKGMDIGVQFLSWARPAENGGSGLVWLKLSSSGEVEPLGNWIMRRHLEYFRESEPNYFFAREAAA